MRRLLALLLLLTPADVSAQEQAPERAAPEPAPAMVVDEEDDPGFGRRPPPPPVVDEEPTPEPVPFTEEDPGMAEQLAPPTVRRRAPRPLGPVAMGFRLSYSTFQNTDLDMEGKNVESRFHALGLDVYPFSEQFRIGLAVRAAMETAEKDWIATVGMTVGLQWRGRRFTPFVTGGMHTGPGLRTFQYTNEFEPPRAETSLTFLWAFEATAGVDMRVGGRALGTVALGVQRIGYFATHGDINDPLYHSYDNTLMLTLGIGY